MAELPVCVDLADRSSPTCARGTAPLRPRTRGPPLVWPSCLVDPGDGPVIGDEASVATDARDAGKARSAWSIRRWLHGGDLADGRRSDDGKRVVREACRSGAVVSVTQRWSDTFEYRGDAVLAVPVSDAHRYQAPQRFEKVARYAARRAPRGKMVEASGLCAQTGDDVLVINRRGHLIGKSGERGSQAGNPWLC